MAMNIKNILYKAVFFLGWVLSPLTFWNDAFVNLPLSYLMANVIIKFIPFNFLITVLVSYWVTNILGVMMMVLSGVKIFKAGKTAAQVFLELFLTVALYSFVLIILNHFGILRPMIR